MPFIHVVPDKAVTVQRVNQRFELPAYVQDSPLFPSILEKATRAAVRKAAEVNKLRGWHWRSDMGVEVDVSELQFDLDTHSRGAVAAEANGTLLELHDKIAYVVKMYYEVPVVHVEDIEYDDDKEARMDGFVKDIKDFEDEV